MGLIFVECGFSANLWGCYFEDASVCSFSRKDKSLYEFSSWIKTRWWRLPCNGYPENWATSNSTAILLAILGLNQDNIWSSKIFCRQQSFQFFYEINKKLMPVFLLVKIKFSWHYYHISVCSVTLIHFHLQLISKKYWTIIHCKTRRIFEYLDNS